MSAVKLAAVNYGTYEEIVQILVLAASVDNFSAAELKEYCINKSIDLA